MKKIAAILGVVLVSLFMTGCGNSPDGDSGRLKNISYLPPL
jgi:hypothetical protein